MALRIIVRHSGKPIINGAEIVGSHIAVGGATGGTITTDTQNGQTIKQQDSTGDVYYDLNGVPRQRNGVSVDGSKSGDWKAKPGENVEDVI